MNTSSPLIVILIPAIFIALIIDVLITIGKPILALPSVQNQIRDAKIVMIQWQTSLANQIEALVSLVKSYLK